ncbi:MAG: hypothetical protein AAF225_06725 [Pseudomonadota bacterium]
MKSNVPWSVKGIDPDARSVAKELARRNGMTLGEWMTQMIKEQGLGEVSPGGPETTVSGVTTDQLRAVVDTLNRLNDRLKSAEKQLQSSDMQSREAMGGLNKGLETVFERVKRLERETDAPADGVGIAERLDRLEGAREKDSWVRSLVALEKALSTLVDQVERSRTDTEQRLDRHEDIVSELKSRFDQEDALLRGELSELLQAVDSTTERVSTTEGLVSEALRAAKDALGSHDETFIERTSQRLQLLGSEIKRTSDNIRTLEHNVARLSEKIEAGEERSAEGISRVAQSVEALRRDVQETSLSASGQGSTGEVRDAVAEADRRITALQGAFASVVDRLDSRDHDEPIGGPDIVQELAEASLVEDFKSGAEDDDEFDRVFDDPLDFRVQKTPTPQTFDADEPRPTQNAHPASFGAVDATDSDAAFGGDNTGFYRQPPPELAARDSEPHFSHEWRAESDFDGSLRDGAMRFGDADPFADEPTLGEKFRALFGRVFAERGDNNTQLGWVLMTLALAAMVFMAVRLIAEDTAIDNPAEMADAGPVVLDRPLGTTTAPIDDTNALYASAKALLASAITAEEIEGGVNAMMRAARAGSAAAQHDLGEMYLTGNFVSADASKSRQWFEEAAKSGNARAVHRLAFMSIDEAYGEVDVEAAIRGFERAASAGLTDAMFNLGMILSPEMDYIPSNRRDIAQAYYWFRLAEEQGDNNAGVEAAGLATDLDPLIQRELDRLVAAWQPTPLRM